MRGVEQIFYNANCFVGSMGEQEKYFIMLNISIMLIAFIMLRDIIMLIILVEAWGGGKIEIYNAKFFDGSMGERKIEIYNAKNYW